MVETRSYGEMRTSRTCFGPTRTDACTADLPFSSLAGMGAKSTNAGAMSNAPMAVYQDVNSKRQDFHQRSRRLAHPTGGGGRQIYPPGSLPKERGCDRLAIRRVKAVFSDWL